MIGADGRDVVKKPPAFPRLEKDDEAERGAGDPVPPGCGKVPGREPMAAELGMKSNKGARRCATPYWTAMSRPLSRGILEQSHKNNVCKFSVDEVYHVP